MTFSEATTSAIGWIADYTSDHLRPTLLKPGETSGSSGVGIAPWRLDLPRNHRTEQGLCLSATARFSVWSWSTDDLEACAAIDAIFFAAMNDTVWRLSGVSPPDAFWPGQIPLSLTLAREIERTLPQPDSGRVEGPLIFDITTRRSNSIGERK